MCRIWYNAEFETKDKAGNGLELWNSGILGLWGSKVGLGGKNWSGYEEEEEEKKKREEEEVVQTKLLGIFDDGDAGGGGSWEELEEGRGGALQGTSSE
ncbi:hypothetical protein NLG97_g8160 [Lecanicillium saksenae]|uniref:Uncharacterized protein n=1 Tax=Lecanicillium saksenae TaxID=468837 RepID=A0ACC1QLG1_9HYPO|nr:hypothetical protein NLG97_g8160 [Lecanicillium saksenae]